MKTFQQFMTEAALVYDTFPEGEVSINEFFGIKKVVKKKEVTPEQRKEFLRQLQKQAKMPAHMSDVARRTNEDYDLSETSTYEP